MAGIPDEKLQELRDKIDIVDAFEIDAERAIEFVEIALVFDKTGPR